VPTALSPLLADDGTGIPYSQLEIIFGSELLYNQIIFTNQITTNTSVANQLDSQNIYGVQTFQRDNLLMSTDQATQDIADFLANKYGQPAFRFEAITIRLNELTPTQQNQILSLDFGDVVQIVFRPGNPPTGSPINEFAEVIAIEQSADPAFHQVKLKFNTLNGTSLILDDVVFGRLDRNALAF
jgi:autonomous glycyl radical cofactor GrcA